MNREDQTLKACFDDLRNEDAAMAPAFVSQIELAQARCRVEPRFSRAYLAAAAIVMAVALSIAFWPRKAAVPNISAWQSPTQALMDPPLESIDGSSSTVVWRSRTDFLLSGS